MSSDQHDHRHEALAPPEVVEVADGVFGYIQPDGTWFINNTGFVAGRRTVLSVDTCATERRTRAYLETVEKVAGAKPTLLVNTHHHGDHTNGNCLAPFATIVGHERCRAEIEATGILDPGGFFEPVDWGDLEPAPPCVTFQHELTLWVDDRRVELRHVTAAAHTTNDIVAWLPDAKVLFAGDLLFNGGTPFVLMGSVAGSLEALDRLVEFDAQVVVPGHGPPCSPAVIGDVGRYLRFVQDLARQARPAGIGPLEAARHADLSDFAHLTDPERLVGNLHRAYAEEDGARPGDPIDLRAAYRDMYAYNGGRPLRCLA